MNDHEKQLSERCEATGQGHLFRFWDGLDETGRQRLASQIAALDFELIAELAGKVKGGGSASCAAPKLEPPPLFPLEGGAELSEQAQRATERGEALLAEGKVGYVLVAGGQGSRLGFDGPKGMFPVGPVAGTTLFAWHARRLLAARERYSAPIAWYVMTSATNDAATRRYFEEERYFGLEPEDVRFFVQAMLPALDGDGRILMAAPDELFLAPNGHGGTLAALAESGCLADARSRGVDVFSYFQVDNPLVRPADPLFLGLHAESGAGMSSKVVAKRDAGEKVGVLGLVDGTLGCIEYSDISDELREGKDADGKLLFRAGNIAVHLLNRDFVERLTQGGLKLPWHLAKKNIPSLDANGALVPQAGVKFETFIFDALAFSEGSVTMEVDRALEFSPVKNASGEDSPESTRRALAKMFSGWAESAALTLPSARDGIVPIEVDPRFAEDEAGFLARMPASASEAERGLFFG